MSASTERKNRQTARSEGTYRKDIAAQKEAAKKKKTQIRWIIVGVVIVLFFAFAIYLNSGALYRSLNGLTVSNTEVTVGDTTLPAATRSFSVAECNYVYNMQYITFVNNYGSYASLFGLDTSKSLDSQDCGMAPEGEEDYTWDDYFRDAAETQLTQLATFEAYAKAHDITATEDDLKSIDEAVDSLSETAKSNNYRSADSFLAANYGKGCNVSVMRGIMELQAIATAVQNSITDAETYTAEQIAEKYDSVKDSYDKFTYSYYYIAAETATNDDGTTADPTDEAKAAAKATADGILASVNGDTALADAAKAAVEGAEIKEQTDLAGSSVESDLSEWIKSADRKEGDTAVVEGASGSYVVVFSKRDNNQAPTEESGDMNYCDYVGQQLLKQDVLSNWNTEVFTVLSEAYTAEFGAVRYIGR